MHVYTSLYAVVSVLFSIIIMIKFL